MRAILLPEPRKPELVDLPDPTPGPGDVVVAVDSCGICGTDIHIYDGDVALTRYPLVPGHEFCGEVAAAGDDAGIAVGTFAAVDPSLPCGRCTGCRRGRANLCERWAAVGVTTDGAFAEYVRVPASNVYTLPASLPRQWGTIVEPLSCAIHAMDRVGDVLGRGILLYGAGTMGLLLVQLIRRAGAATIDVVDVRPERLPIAEALGADEVAGEAHALSRPKWDLVVDATGAVGAIEDGLARVARGGTFLVFGVAAADATARFSPFAIYNEEITILGSMAVLHSFGRAVELLASRAVDAEPLITSRLPLASYEEAIAAVRRGDGFKTQLVPSA